MSDVCFFTTHSSGSRSPRVRSRVQWVSMKVGWDESQMAPQWAPAVTQAGQGPGVQQHLPHGLEAHLGVVEDGEVEEPVPVGLEHGVEGDLEGWRPGPRRWPPVSAPAPGS